MGPVEAQIERELADQDTTLAAREAIVRMSRCPSGPVEFDAVTVIGRGYTPADGMV